MVAATFQLLPIIIDNHKTNLQYLLHRKSGLRINIIPLIRTEFKPKPNEVQYYGKLFSWHIAFETEGYCNQPHALIKKGIRWYAALKLVPAIEITSHDPRKLATNQSSG